MAYVWLVALPDVLADLSAAAWLAVLAVLSRRDYTDQRRALLLLVNAGVGIFILMTASYAKLKLGL